jgi:hypothetical protein
MSDVLQRILSRVSETESGCWEFGGYRLPAGYGRLGWNGRLWLTHRVTYTLLVGPIPEGLEIDHLCRNKPCCNPSHLEAVTRSENIRRGPQGEIAAERERAKTECPLGHPYDAINTYFAPDGYRQCRICKRLAGQRYSARSRDRINSRAREYRLKKKEAA